MQPLVGHLRYRVRLLKPNDNGSEVAAAVTTNDGDASATSNRATTAAVGTKRKASDMTGGDQTRPLPARRHYDYPFAGWTFTPLSSSSSSSGTNENNHRCDTVMMTTMAAVIPQGLVSLAARANAQEALVQVDRYTYDSVLVGPSSPTTQRTTSSSSNGTGKTGSSSTLPALVVSENGLRLWSDDDGGSKKGTLGPTETTATTNNNKFHRQDFLTLSQVAKLDYFWRQTGQKPPTATPPPTCSIVGCVQAVSPVIAMDLRDPFCLIELVQPTTPSSSCADYYSTIIVLRKDGLAQWPALQPGATVAFAQASRKSWRIPQVLAALRPKRTPPAKCLVVEAAWQVVLVDAPSSSSCPLGDDSFSVDDSRAMTAKVCGRIREVRYLRLSSQYNAVHRVAIQLDKDGAASVGGKAAEDKVAYLFLTYFPMDTCLRSSIRVGAEILAYSLRSLHLENRHVAYEATLRSSVFVTKPCCVGQSSRSMVVAGGRETACETGGYCPPFYFAPKMKTSCTEFWRRWQCRSWLEDCVGLDDDTEWNARSLGNQISEHVFARLASKDSISLPAKRNPYAEFFECQGRLDQSKCESQSGDNNHGRNRMPESAVTRTPRLVRLESLRESALSEVPRRLGRQWGPRGRCSIFCGWTACFVRPCQDLVFTGGVSNHTATPPVTVPSASGLIVSSRQVSLPIVLEEEIKINVGRSLVVIEATGTVVSLVCLGRATAPPEGEQPFHDLPCHDDLDSHKIGCCQLLVFGRQLFLCSVHIKGKLVTALCSNGAALDLNVSLDQRREGFQTVQDSLSVCKVDDVPSDRLVASVLVRKSIRFCKARHGKYNGLCLTLSHAPSNEGTEAHPSLQSIEIKPVVSLETSNRLKMKHYIEHVFSQECSEELIDTASALWKVADSHNTCAIVAGGWDEIASSCKANALAESLGIKVLFPSTSIERDTKRGYVRFRCALKDLRCGFISLNTEKKMNGWTLKASPFDFAGGAKVFPGMLDRRPRRLGQARHDGSSRFVGQLARPLDGAMAGIPSCTLSELHRCTCLDLRESSLRRHLSPSCVREIRGARFMGISFCEVYAECTQCFNKLVRPKNQRSNRSAGTSKSSREVPSYWHLPLGKQKGDVSHGPPRQTNLVCRNGCPAHKYAMRWECSGTLDDGTGQGKLYAEREAAVTLLGMDSATVEMIEAGVWNMEDGLIFSRGVPAKAHLCRAVQTAQTLARAELGSQQRKRRGGIPASMTKNPCLDEEAMVLQRMSPACRAEYLLQVHCRRSARPIRPLVYYVRCKPISDEVCFVNHTETNVAVPSEKTAVEGMVQAAQRKTVTYALPPLKLNLVDMASVAVQ